MAAEIEDKIYAALGLGQDLVKEIERDGGAPGGGRAPAA